MSSETQKKTLAIEGMVFAFSLELQGQKPVCAYSKMQGGYVPRALGAFSTRVSR